MPPGNFFPKNQNDDLLNPCSIDKIPVHWKPLIDEVKSHFLKIHGDQFHSFYLRGSVAAGSAIDGLADLDTFALFKNKEIWWTADQESVAFCQALCQKYPFVSEVEIMLSGIRENGQLVNRHLAPVIKLQSICLAGEDLGPALPEYQPGRALMRNYRWIKEDVTDLQYAEKLSLPDIRSALKTIIRTGFELVMEREQRFTTDLDLCCQSFAKYYPQWEKEMRFLLAAFLAVPDDRKALKSSVGKIGEWLVKEVEQNLKADCIRKTGG